ncbi:MAG: ATP-binding cassette domain-containing protein [Chitinivibrionales bacterium]|nr:ATP-binding cassette domain-containing protein [Chitinivibrionales bacterium]MBD3396681.1 ATP-binding cassette domain-containing protein [Chitinivibrionales bacterium]
MAGLQITGIRKTFHEVVALEMVSLDITEGELFFLLGPSGCGKTTLLRIIAGFDKPDTGGIRFAGKDLLAIPVEKRNIGMVFQNYSLWPHMSVSDNVAYGMKMRGMRFTEIRRRVADALTMVDMAGLEDRKPGALSGGQQQRVALARALVYEPGLLLLDEPLSNLDAKLRKDMREEIRKIHRRLGITMVYVTHDQEEAASMADRLALMRDGRVVQVGTPKELYRSPRSLYAAQFFGRANSLDVIVSSVSASAAGIAWGDRQLVAAVPKGGMLSPGARATAIVRPENMRFAASDTKQNVLHGTLAAREFNGAVENFTIDVHGTALTLMTVFAPREQISASVGDRVGVTFDPDAVHLVTEGIQP